MLGTYHSITSIYSCYYTWCSSNGHMNFICWYRKQVISLDTYNNISMHKMISCKFNINPAHRLFILVDNQERRVPISNKVQLSVNKIKCYFTKSQDLFAGTYIARHSLIPHSTHSRLYIPIFQLIRSSVVQCLWFLAQNFLDQVEQRFLGSPAFDLAQEHCPL